MEQQLAERATLEVEAHRNRSELAELEARAAEPEAPGIEAEVVELPPEQIAGQNRQRDTALVAVGAFVASWLVCLVTILKDPLRRGERRQAAEPPAGDSG